VKGGEGRRGEERGEAEGRDGKERDRGGEEAGWPPS